MKMNKILKNIIISCVALAVVLPINIPEIYAKDEDAIKVGYLKNYGIINEPIIQGSEGFGYEYLCEVEKYTDYKFEYVSVEWNEGLEKLKAGDIDMFGLAAMTSERLEDYNYIGAPICYEKATLYTSKDSPLYYKDTKGLNGLTVGVASDSSDYINSIRNYEKENNIELFVKEVSNSEFVNQVNTGEIDLFLSASLLQYENSKIIDELSTVPVYLMTSKENTVISDEIETAINKIESENPYLNEVLWNKYYKQNQIAKQRITSAERKVLDKQDVYVVGYHVDLHPISYKDSDGNPSGYAVAVMDKLAMDLGINLKYIPMHDENDNSADDIDFNLCVLDDKDFINRHLSEPYYYHNLMFIRESDVAQEQVKNISSLDYATINIEDHISAYTNAELHKVYSSSESAKLSKDIDVDCYAALEGRAEILLDTIDSVKYDIDIVGVKVPLGITVSSNLPIEVKTALDKAILSLDESYVEELIAENLNDLSPEASFWEVIRRFLWLIIVVAVVAICFIALIYIRIINKNQLKLRTLLDVDQLTGIMTLEKFKEEMEKILKTGNPNEYYLLSFDVDNFKYVNQTYGFEKGNEFLCIIADSMEKYSNHTSFCCRYQDDIFLVFGKVREQFQFTLDNTNFGDFRIKELTREAKLNIPIHFSIGVFIIDEPTQTTDYMIDCVRKVRQISKRKHGNTITVYSDEIKKRLSKERIIYTSMEQAIDNEEFFIVIQPKIELQSGRLVGGEVLVRWGKGNGELIYPDDFIPLFEKNQFIVVLDRYVFELTCRYMKSINVELPRISVNVSAVTAREEKFLSEYMDILRRYQLSPENFELELTESALEDDFDAIKKVSQHAKELGFSLSIDDFGKGASSLTRVRELNVDIIKLDRGFIADQAEKGRVVIENIISMANNLGFITLAEGIETKEDLDLLVEFGCDYGQGYYFDKPLSTEEFLERVVCDSKKTYPKVIKSSEKIKDYLTNFENLPYGVAIIKNDPFFTVVKANKEFYKLIENTSVEFFENFNNRFTDISYDNIRAVVDEKLSNYEYDFEMDLRIVSAGREIVWVHDYVHYDVQQDLFFVTFTDITEQSLLQNADWSFEGYQAQKASMIHLSNHTSAYIFISDMKTGNLVYVNRTAMKYFGFKNEKDIVNKKFRDIAFGDYKEDIGFNLPLSENEFSKREYYNEKHRKYICVESRIISVVGKKMRLSIVTDITDKKQAENEIFLQSTLNNCVEYLYSASNSSSLMAIHKTLDEIKMYYNADRAYFYKFRTDSVGIENCYEVLADGVASANGVYDLIPEENRLWLLGILAEKGTIYQQSTKGLEDTKQEFLSPVFLEQKVNSFIYCAVKDSEGAVIGFLGVDNPKANEDNSELMTLLSRFIWLFIKSITSKQLEDEAVKLEEISKINILEKCTKVLQDLKQDSTVITDILDSIRSHYGASFVVILSISKDGERYEVTHESLDSETPSIIAVSKNRQIESITRWIKRFSRGVQITESTIEDLTPNSAEWYFWNDYNVGNVVTAPMYNQNGNLIGILAVSNITISNRSKALIYVVAKYISDYFEKSKIHKRNALDPLTGLFNKIATEDKVTNLLENGDSGVLFIIDIDHFKNINDTLGHIVGDRVLIDLASSLKSLFRSGDIIGRIGGDEFMVFCCEAISDEIIHEKATSILNAANRVYERDGFRAKSTVSIGICRVEEESEDFQSLYEKTDKVMYEAKKNGKNQYQMVR